MILGNIQKAKEPKYFCVLAFNNALDNNNCFLFLYALAWNF